MAAQIDDCARSVTPVPEHDVLADVPSSSPFEGTAAQSGPLLQSPVTLATPSTPAPQAAPKRRGLAGLFTSCFGGAALAADAAAAAAADDPQSSQQPTSSGAVGGVPKIMSRNSASPRKSRRSIDRHSWKQTGSVYSDADWHDAVSTFSAAADQEAMLEEVQQMVKELGSFKAAPWIPDPPLAFGQPNMHFVPVPAQTGFAAYWLRDDERTTPFPQPIDLMVKAPYLVLKMHASIPGIWIQETDTELSITATPKFVPPFLGISGYVENYDKSNMTEPSWMPRRDIKMGRAYGKLYFTADGMMIARVWQKPAFSDKVDIIMEEYMFLEQGGQVIVDRMTCLQTETGKRATQYLVGWRRDAPGK